MRATIASIFIIATTIGCTSAPKDAGDEKHVELAPSGRFEKPAEYATGDAPGSIAVGDLNGDGKPDVVVANEFGGSISIFLNQGGGKLGPRSEIKMKFQTPVAIALADVNGDGKLDLLVALDEAQAIGVFLGKGDGTFGEMRSFTTTAHPQAFAVADMDGDGKLDLVVARVDEKLELLRGKGDGTFARWKTIKLPRGVPRSVAVGDLDGDGVLDVVVAQNLTHASDGPEVRRVTTLMRPGKAELEPKSIELGFYPSRIALLGRDAIVCGEGAFVAESPDHPMQTKLVGDGAALLEGDGKGGFSTKPIEVPRGPCSIALIAAAPRRPGVARSFNTAIACLHGGCVTLLEHNLGSDLMDYRDAVLVANEPVDHASGVAIADMNGDGKPDLLVIDRDAAKLFVLLAR